MGHKQESTFTLQSEEQTQNAIAQAWERGLFVRRDGANTITLTGPNELMQPFSQQLLNPPQEVADPNVTTEAPAQE